MSVYLFRFNKCSLQTKHVFVCLCDYWSSSSCVLCWFSLVWTHAIELFTLWNVFCMCVMNITECVWVFSHQTVCVDLLRLHFLLSCDFLDGLLSFFQSKMKEHKIQPTIQFCHLCPSFFFRWTQTMFFVNGGQTKAAFPLIQAVFVFKPH